MDTEVVKTKDLETAVDGALDLMGQQQEQLYRAELENQRLRAELAMAEEVLSALLPYAESRAEDIRDQGHVSYESIKAWRRVESARAFLNREGR